MKTTVETMMVYEYEMMDSNYAYRMMRFLYDSLINRFKELPEKQTDGIEVYLRDAYCWNLRDEYRVGLSGNITHPLWSIEIHDGAVWYYITWDLKYDYGNSEYIPMGVYPDDFDIKLDMDIMPTLFMLQSHDIKLVITDWCDGMPNFDRSVRSFSLNESNFLEKALEYAIIFYTKIIEQSTG